jgi:hypothetical protein
MAELRIGNTERERASHLLGDHYASGRLDDDEYAERLDAVWSARTRADLDLLFHDLPRPVATAVPARASRPPVSRRRGPRVGPPLALLLVGLMMLTVVTGAPWWLLAVGVVALLTMKGPACR